MQQSNPRKLGPPKAVELFWKRETGLVKNVAKYNMMFLRQLIGSDDFCFKQVYCRNQRGKIQIRFDKVFIRNGRDVYSIYSKKIRPSFRLYTIDTGERVLRLAETKFIAHKSTINRSVITPREQFRPFLLILTENNYLLHFDFETGELLGKIYLGSIERCKFIYLMWVTYSITISIASADLKDPENKRSFRYVILLSVFPFKFIGCFRIDSDIFGASKSASLTEGMLILYRSRYVNKIISIYSLEQILDPSNCLWKTDIGQVCEAGNECDECASSSLTNTPRIVGSEGHGFPENFKITKTPPVLMRITTCHEVIEYGGHPFHIIYSPPSQRDTFVIERLEDGQVINNGSISFENLLEEHHRLIFHYDSVDERVLSIDSHKITFHQIVDGTLNKLFSVSCTPAHHLHQIHRRLITCKKAKKSDIMQKSIFSNVYDPETDIFCLLGIDLSSVKQDKPVICLFDNINGRLLKKFNLSFKSEETNDYEVIIDRDMLLITETRVDGPDRVFCYRLTRRYC